MTAVVEALGCGFLVSGCQKGPGDSDDGGEHCCWNGSGNCEQQQRPPTWDFSRAPAQGTTNARNLMKRHLGELYCQRFVYFERINAVVDLGDTI